MEALTATRAPRRSSLLQLLRSFFGLLRNVRGTQEPGVEGEELGAVGDSGSYGGWLAGQQHPYWEPWEGAEGESTEPLLGELEGLSLAGSLGSSRSGSCLTGSTSDTELVCEVADTPASSPAQQHAGRRVASQEGTAMPEGFGDKALETDWLLQGLGADGEDVTCGASPEPVFSVDFDAECEKEQLLKADEGAGSPTAELSQWNMLFSTNKHRQTSHKPHALGSLMELESEEEPLLNAAANRPATPAPTPRAPTPSAVAAAARRQSRRNPWLLWEKLGTAGSRWRRSPWKSLRSSSRERSGAAPDGPPCIGSPPGGESDSSALAPTPVPTRLSPVLRRSSAPAFSSSLPHVSL
ncbi:uncharacterized protein FN964_014398 isoform 1-T1 [Alca torda]